MKTSANTIAAPAAVSTNVTQDSPASVLELITNKESRLSELKAEEQALVLEIAKQKQAQKDALHAALLKQIAALPGAFGVGSINEVIALIIHTSKQDAMAHARSFRGSGAIKLAIHKGRHHGKARRLTEAEYMAIRQALKTDKDPDTMVTRIAKRYGVSRQTVYTVKDSPKRERFAVAA